MPGGWGAVIVVLHCVAPRAWQSSTSLREALLPGGWGAAIPFIPLRGAFSLPRGPRAVARAGHRAQPSDPPARATEQGRPAPGPLAVRMRPRQRHPAAGRPLGARTRRRDGSCGPRSGTYPHTPVHHGPAWESSTMSSGGGQSIRPAGGAAMPPSAAGCQACGPGWGVGDASSCGHRGAPPRDALPGRGRRSLGARRAGASKRRVPPHPPGKRKSHAVEERGQTAGFNEPRIQVWRGGRLSPRRSR